MSLQGSLDSFALPDVLSLLAGSRKSGELHVAGHRRVGAPGTPDLQGSLWFEDGHLVGAEVPRADDLADAIFELLRLGDGTFSFLTGTAAQPSPPEDVAPLLAEAQTRLEEWREIEKVVPSLAAWLELAGEAPGAQVSMRGEQWRLVAAIGGGCDVDAALARLGLRELPGCRAVKELVEIGLVTLQAREAEVATPEDEPAGVPAIEAAIEAVRETTTAALRAVAPPLEPPDTDAVPAAEEPAGRVVSGLFGGTEEEAPDWLTSPSSSTGEASAQIIDVARARADDDQQRGAPDDRWSSHGWRLDESTGGDDLVSIPDRLMGGRTPSAGRAAAHAAAAHAAAEPAQPAPDASRPGRGEPAPDASGLVDGETAEDGEEPLNRGLLLKFLSSVRN